MELDDYLGFINTLENIYNRSYCSDEDLLKILDLKPVLEDVINGVKSINDFKTNLQIKVLKNIVSYIIMIRDM